MSQLIFHIIVLLSVLVLASDELSRWWRWLRTKNKPITWSITCSPSVVDVTEAERKHEYTCYSGVVITEWGTVIRDMVLDLPYPMTEALKRAVIDYMRPIEQDETKGYAEQ